MLETLCVCAELEAVILKQVVGLVFVDKIEYVTYATNLFEMNITMFSSVDVIKL